MNILGVNRTTYLIYIQTKLSPAVKKIFRYVVCSITFFMLVIKQSLYSRGEGLLCLYA